MDSELGDVGPSADFYWGTDWSLLSESLWEDREGLVLGFGVSKCALLSLLTCVAVL